ncbi:hypothetical protein [uncultured Gordonia sp.]|uniref:hypothetical protein n=1 Tax=uncultured Gordonia sp. TaxID=198437 RepID=UPI002619E3DA|nr:hypothetical protein [uncultured Gordonia sp.]
MILDIRVLSGVTPSALVAAVAAHVPGEVGVDQYGNPSLRTDAGTIVAAESLWDTGLVYAEVRSSDAALANRVYDVLVDNTDWEVSLVDSSDNHPEDVVLRHRAQPPNLLGAEKIPNG